MQSLRIAIIGAGNFGNALEKLFRRYGSGHIIQQFDKQAGSEQIENVGRLSDFDVIIPAVPISQFRQVLQQIAAVIADGATVVDVCTIKEKTTADMLEILPDSTRLISTHPLFGPESLAANQWNLSGLKTMVWPTRIDSAVFEQFVSALRDTGLDVVKLSPAIHDNILADSQFLSLLIGAILVRMNTDHTPINTRSFDELLDVKATTCHDYAILRDVFRYNAHCSQTLDRLRKTLDEIADDLRRYQ